MGTAQSGAGASLFGLRLDSNGFRDPAAGKPATGQRGAAERVAEAFDGERLRQEVVHPDPDERLDRCGAGTRVAARAAGSARRLRPGASRAPLRGGSGSCYGCSRMRRLLKWLGILVAGIGIAVAGLVAYVYVASGRVMARTYAVEAPRVAIPTDAASIARGKYLTEKVAVCTECHGADLGGKVVDDDFAMGRLGGVNLTRGRGGLPADYSDQDFVRALTHGVKRDGRSVVFMPVADYVFTADDLGAIVAYVKSMPPVDRTVPPLSVGPVARALGLFVDFPLASASMIDHSQPRLAARPESSDAVGERQVSDVERRLPRLPRRATHRRWRSAARRLEHHAGRHRRVERARLRGRAAHTPPAERIGHRRRDAARLRRHVR